MSQAPKPIAVRSTAENCARIRKLGYIAGKHMNLYGEHLELVSDPFEESDCVAVHAVSESNPTERTIEPTSILAGYVRQLLFRPTRSLYRISHPGLYLCGAFTLPGGGVHGMCGVHAAKMAVADLNI
jgi:hypothetical protein